MATPEALAKRIQQGELQLLPDLWESVRRYVYQQANKWSDAWHDRRPGLEADDLVNAAYIQIVEDIQSYDPGKASFITWLEYPIKTAFSEVVGCRTPAQQKRPENNADSLTRIISAKDNSLTLGDMIEDPDAERALQAVEDDVYQSQSKQVIQDAVARLPERQQLVIRGRYYDDKTLKEVSADIGVSAEMIRQNERKALRTLGKDPAVRELHYTDRNLYKRTGLSSWKNSGCSVQEIELLWEERYKQYRRYNPDK